MLQGNRPGMLHSGQNRHDSLSFGVIFEFAIPIIPYIGSTSFRTFILRFCWQMNACSGANLYLYIRNRVMFVLVKTRMDEIQKNFWIGVGIGAVIIIIIDLLVSFLGPFIGGFTAGYIAEGIFSQQGNRINCWDSGCNRCFRCRLCWDVITSGRYIPEVVPGFSVYRHFPVSGSHRLPWRCYCGASGNQFCVVF